MNDLLMPGLPLAALYAETHYLFPFFPFSRYYRRQPEIIFDAPHRLEPGLPLPVTLIIKDAHRFPIELLEIVIRMEIGKWKMEQKVLVERALECPFWHELFYLDCEKVPYGLIEVTCSLTFNLRGRRHIVQNDNHPGLSHAPLKVYRSEHRLPLLPGWMAGELHCHTSYGPDYVEFGAPLEAIQRTAEAIGLSFAALTDHSYNLDDLPDDFRQNDPTLAKWQMLREESGRLSRDASVTLLPGEELSCRNSGGRNVHLILLGNREFLTGSGDGAERWFRTRSEFSVAEALAKLQDDAVAIAAHPLVPTPPLEYLLVGRGEWLPADLAHPRLDGWQIVNGSWEIDFERGLKAWQETLAGGGRRIIFGGNDAHGNFNRFRQVRIPMFNLWEHDRNIFGRFRTLVKTSGLGESALLTALKSSSIVVSDGPSLDLSSAGEGTAILRFLSTPEFGAVESIDFWAGQGGAEVHIPSTTLLAKSYSGDNEVRWHGSYLRAELRTRTDDGQVHRALTNPLFQVDR